MNSLKVVYRGPVCESSGSEESYAYATSRPCEPVLWGLRNTSNGLVIIWEDEMGRTFGNRNACASIPPGSAQVVWIPLEAGESVLVNTFHRCCNVPCETRA